MFVCALKRLMGICSLCVCVCFFSVRSITFLIEQKHHLLQESFTVRHRAHRVQFPTEMTFPEVCTVLLIKQQGVLSSPSRNPIRINPSNVMASQHVTTCV